MKKSLVNTCTSRIAELLQNLTTIIVFDQKIFPWRTQPKAIRNLYSILDYNIVDLLHKFNRLKKISNTKSFESQSNILIISPFSWLFLCQNPDRKSRHYSPFSPDRTSSSCRPENPWKNSWSSSAARAPGAGPSSGIWSSPASPVVAATCCRSNLSSTENPWTCSDRLFSTSKKSDWDVPFRVWRVR